MKRDELIIAVYLLVCEHMKALQSQWPRRGPLQQPRLRGGGFAPDLSDEEALTIELCGEMFRLRTDKSLYAYFDSHWRDFFPRLPCRTSFVRQCANLWQVKQHLTQHLAQQMDAFQAVVQPVDTMPLPVCARARARRDRCFADVARVGFCAAKNLFYYGFKLGLRITPTGFITQATLLQANTHDCRHLPALVEGHRGLAPVDKGFFDPTCWRLLVRQGVHVVGRGPRKVAHTAPAELEVERPLARACHRIRKLIETVGAHLCERFGVDEIRVRDLWHFQHRLGRKILAHNLLVTLNLQRGRPPLDFDALVGD